MLPSNSSVLASVFTLRCDLTSFRCCLHQVLDAEHNSTFDDAKRVQQNLDWMSAIEVDRTSAAANGRFSFGVATLEPGFRFVVLQAQAALAPNCIDIATNVPPLVPMRTIQNSTVITAITTLVSVMMERPNARGPDMNLEDAAIRAVRTALDLPDDFDPMFDECIEVRFLMPK